MPALFATMREHWINVLNAGLALVMDKSMESFDWYKAVMEDTPFCHHSFRRTFVYGAKPGKAVAHIAARSLYKCHVNGRFVMFGPARSPSAYCYVDSFDIGPHLREGRNVVAIETVYVGPRTEYDYGRPGFACALELDGEIIHSDSSWRHRDWRAYASKAEAGNLRASYAAEKLHLSKIDPDWTADFYDDSAWETVPAGACGPADCELRQCPFALPELREMPRPLAVDCVGDIRLGPVTEFHVSNAESYLILDFGRTVSGLYELSGRLPKGATLSCEYLEWLNSFDGSSVKSGYPCGPAGFALVGAGDPFKFQTFHPYSCRYLKIKVEGLPAGEHATLNDVLARELCALPSARRAHALCSDYVLNRAMEAAQNTLRVCAPDMYVDCSSHERRIYLHDSLWEIEAGNIFFGDTAISQAFLDVLPDCLGRIGKFPHLVQGGVLCSGGALKMATLGHSLTWIIQGFVHAKFAGSGLTQKFVETAKSMLEDVRAATTPEGLIVHDEALCQWLDWSKMHQNGGVSTGINALYYKALSMLAQATGDKDLLKCAGALREQMRSLILPFIGSRGFRYSRLVPDLFVRGADGRLAAFGSLHAKSFGANGDKYCSETTQYWILWSGLLEKSEERRLWEPLRELRVNEESRQDDNRLYAFSRAGLFGLWVRLSYAFENGDTDLIYRDIRDICRPMLDRGDTLWESICADARSNAHGFNAYAGTLLYKCISGILPDAGGYERPLIAPRPDPSSGPGWGRGFMQLKGGVLGVNWTLSFDSFSLKVSLPEGCCAKVRLPPEAAAIAARGGRTLERLDFEVTCSSSFNVTIAEGLKIS